MNNKFNITPQTKRLLKLGGVFVLMMCCVLSTGLVYKKKQEKKILLLEKSKMQDELNRQEKIWPHSYYVMWQLERNIGLLEKADLKDIRYKQLKKQILNEYRQNRVK